MNWAKKTRYPVDNFCVYVDMSNMFFVKFNDSVSVFAFHEQCHSQAFVTAGCGACPAWDASPVPGGSFA